MKQKEKRSTQEDKEKAKSIGGGCRRLTITNFGAVENIVPLQIVFNMNK